MCFSKVMGAVTGKGPLPGNNNFFCMALIYIFWLWWILIGASYYFILWINSREQMMISYFLAVWNPALSRWSIKAQVRIELLSFTEYKWIVNSLSAFIRPAFFNGNPFNAVTNYASFENQPNAYQGRPEKGHPFWKLK